MVNSKFKDLKKAYVNAVKEGKDTFMIDDYKLLTMYAKYLIEYLGDLKTKDNTLLKEIISQEE